MLISQLTSKLGTDGRRKIHESRIGQWIAANTKQAADELRAESASRVADVYAGLPGYAVEVLNAMLLSCGPTPWEEERLVAELRLQARLSGSEVRTGLARLGEAGIAYAIRRAWGEQWWVLPSDLYAVLIQYAYPGEPTDERWQTSEVLPLMDETGQFIAAPVPFERTFMYGLSILARSDAALTSKGVLAKKAIDKLSVLFESVEASLQPFALQRNLAGHYPLGVAVFLEAAHACGLFEIREQRFAMREQCLRSWLRNPNRALALQDWLTGRLMEIAGPYSSPCSDILCMRGQQGDAGWHSESALTMAEERRLGMRQSSRKAADWQKQSRWAGAWLDLFYAFGWLEVGQPAGAEPSGERLYRWKSRAEERDAELIIQPSGELIAGPGCGFVCRWELELIAERKLDGELTQYALTPRALANALELGRSRTSIADFLVAASGLEQLPPSIVMIVDQWTSGAGQFEFVQATLLRCGSPERADWLADHPEAGSYVIQRLGPSEFVVDGEQISKLRKLLQQAGYPPRKGVSESFCREENESEPAYPEYRLSAGSSADEPEISPGSIGTEGLFIGDPASLRHCALSEAPVPERLLASDWQSVPQMWSNQLREYHLSTRKELLQKAIALETSVRMKSAGELKTFIPERLDQRGNDWAVVGLWREGATGEEARLSPDMWDEMGLALPEGLPL
jgi:hypothetical protein